MPKAVAVPIEALAILRRRLAALPGGIRSGWRSWRPHRSFTRSAERHCIACCVAIAVPKTLIARTEAGRDPCQASEIERWCEIVAAMKLRTTNKKGRHLSTVRTLQLLVEHGVDTPDGFQKLAPGRLTAMLFTLQSEWRH